MNDRPIRAPLALLFALSCAGCASAPRPGPSTADTRTTAALDPAVRAAKVRNWRAWEPKGLTRRRVEFPDVSVTAELESATEPKVECNQLQSGGTLCVARLDLGKDDEGEAKTLDCSVVVDRVPLPFGVLFKNALGRQTLEEVPKLEVENSQHGLAAWMLVPSYFEDERNVSYGNTKVAVAYGPGFSLSCEDAAAGANETFRRISRLFFGSAARNKSPASPVFRTAYKSRRGEATSGFSVHSVVKEDEGYFESHTAFHLESDGKSWHIYDGLTTVERSGTGAVDSMRAVRWFEGNTPPAIITAKPSEGGKLRLKLELGEKSDSLEITPQAPLSTESWEAPSLLKLSSGASQAHRYGFLSISEDGEPTILYAKLSRAKQGAVVEEIDHAGKKKKATDGAPLTPERNEISVDERGFSTKQVSSDGVYERLFVLGDLPGRAPATGKGRAPSASGRKP